MEMTSGRRLRTDINLAILSIDLDECVLPITQPVV